VQEIWLAGKGVSLFTYDWGKANEYRIGINHAACYVPKCYGAFALDYEVLDYYKKYLDTSITVYRKRSHIDYDFENMILWDKTIAPNIFATSVAAVQVFYSYGCRVMHMVGFDSIDGDCSRPEEIVKVSGIGKVSHYHTINNVLLEVIAKLSDLKIIWEHKNV
jgi:hypothetical protein